MAGTVGDLVDRVIRSGLYGGDNQPIIATLNIAMSAGSTNLLYTLGELSPEEEGSLAPGVILEMGTEQVRIKDFRTKGALTVQKGVNGTTKQSHSIGDQIIIAPTFSRQTVFDAVADGVPRLHPRLWQTGEASTARGNPFTAVPADATGVIEVLDLSGGTVRSVPHREIVSGTGGVRLYTDVNDSATSLSIVYRKGFTRPTSEATSMLSLGVKDEWLRIIEVDAIAHLLSGTLEIDQLSSNWLTESLEASVEEPLTAARLAAQLDNYRQSLLDDASAALARGRAHRITYRDPFTGLVQ